MTEEEKREQLLKRMLPGLAVTVIYFVFISGIVSESMKKAETEYKTLMMSGVSKDALPGVINQQQQTQQQLSDLQRKVTEAQDKLKTMAGFLSNDGSSTNLVMRDVSKILSDSQVRLSKDQKEQLPEAQLSPALKEIWQAVKPVESNDKKTPQNPPAAAQPATTTTTTIAVRHLWLKGSYVNMYNALTALTEPKLQVLPVALTMQMPEGDTDNATDRDWELILWM